MKKSRFLVPLCAIFTILLLAQFSHIPSDAIGVVDPIPDNGWEMPVDVPANPTRSDWLQFGWESFVALNWPADNNWPKAGDGGKPNSAMNITDKEALDQPTVWQTYLEPGQLFLENGEDPGTWDQPHKSIPTKFDGTDLLQVLGGFGEKGLFFFDQNPVEGLVLYDLALTSNPVIDQNKNFVLLEVRLNQSEFNYFKETGYCDACVQSAILRDSADKFQHMPVTGKHTLPEWAQQGAIEIKASWKILEESTDIKSRYFTTKGYQLHPNQKDTLGPYTLGLVGLHILRNTPQSAKTWYWTTFEQVDNVKIYDPNPPLRPNKKPLSASFNPGLAGAEPTYPYGFDTEGRIQYNLKKKLLPPFYANPIIKPARIEEGQEFPAKKDRAPVNCSRVTDIPKDVQKINKEFQAKLAGTPWQYYEMIDALYPDTNGIYELLRSNDKPHIDPIYANVPALINSTMETYLTFRLGNWSIDNCLNCHYDAEPRTFKNALRTDTATQAFSYLYRRALPSHPNRIKIISDTSAMTKYKNEWIHLDCDTTFQLTDLARFSE